MKLIETGCRNLLVAMFQRDATVNNLYGQPEFDDGSVAFDRDKETRTVLAAFETFRKEIPAEIGLAVDVHSLLDPIRATRFGKDVEAFRLFYCEDLFSPEEAGHYRVRHHVSHIGGFTAARKIAAFAENYEVKFAWHGAPNSPVGSMTNLTLDLTHENFGIHEHFDYPPLVKDIFRGHLQIKDGYAWISDEPGWGIEVECHPGHGLTAL